MSKLNDSTLKILKKYRLDTDMSVFGNENKLYDVVKVMDDMVGNQVSKYVANIAYLDSTRYDRFQMLTIDKPVISISDTSWTGSKPVSNLYYFNRLSMKQLFTITPNDTKIPICEIFSNRSFIGVLAWNSTINVIQALDYSLNKPLDTSLISRYIGFARFLIFSETPYTIGTDSFPSIKTMINYNDDTHPTSETNYAVDFGYGGGIITLPELVKNFDSVYSQIQYTGSSSYYIKGLPTLDDVTITSKLNITEV